jgi:hypothetical protein
MGCDRNKEIKYRQYQAQNETDLRERIADVDSAIERNTRKSKAENRCCENRVEDNETRPVSSLQGLERLRSILMLNAGRISIEKIDRPIFDEKENQCTKDHGDNACNKCELELHILNNDA